MASNFRVEIKGDKELNLLLYKIKRRAPEFLDSYLDVGAEMTKTNAIKSIAAHSSEGKTYYRGTISHTASAPGNPPNTDTGNLVKNITKQKIRGGYDAGSRKDAPYGFFLEFGTRNMEPRPWLTPAFKSAIEKLKEVLRKKKNDGLI